MKTGVWKRSARSNDFDRELEALGRIRREQQDVFGVAVRGVGALQNIALLRARGHAGGRADALHVDDHRRNLGVVGQAQQLVHQRNAGAGGRRERARAVPGRADHHADGGQFVLGLQDAGSCSCRSRDPCGTCSQKLLNASITEVDGVMGYQAATVAPA